jgi:phosphopantetheine--protein transferase-like protein
VKETVKQQAALSDEVLSATKIVDRGVVDVLMSSLHKGKLFGVLRQGNFETGGGDAVDESVETGSIEGSGMHGGSDDRAAGNNPRPAAGDTHCSAATPSAGTKLEVTMLEAAGGMQTRGGRGIGIDVEPSTTFESASSTFIRRNFTDAEQAYCMAAGHPAASYAGRWAAKEAVIKAISSIAPDSRNLWKGSAAPLKDIEVVRSESGAPVITLHGHAKMVAAALGINEVKVSISHVAENAVAQANTF